MAKPVIKATKGYREGHISLSLSADSHHFGVSVASKISIAIDLDAAHALQAEIAEAIAKAEAKRNATADREARRRTWRDREITAGRIKVMSIQDIFRK